MSVSLVTHFSEISLFLRCQRAHYFRYVLGREEPPKMGRSMVGTMGHAGLAALLQGQDPMAAVLASVPEDVEVPEDEVHPHELVADVVEIATRGVAVLRAAMGEGHRILGVERPFEWRDPEVDEFTVVGTADLVFEEASGHAWVVDHKFRAKFVPESAELFNLQMAIYQKLAAESGVPTIGTMQAQFFPGLPAMPKLNKPKKKGALAEMSRADIKSDWPTYERALLSCGLDPADYEDMRDKLAAKKFHDLSARAYRPPEEVENVWAHVVRPTLHQIGHARRNPDAPGVPCMQQFACQNCAYRNPCSEMNKGGDWQMMLEVQFPREGEKPTSFELIDDTEESEDE